MIRKWTQFAAALLILAAPLLRAAIIDRIAVIVGDSVITDSAIDRDIRITDLLNGDKLDFSLAERRKAANRLIDQAVIRKEFESGNYQSAPESEVISFLQQIKLQRFPTDAQFQEALKKYGVTAAELRKQIQWQLDVLRFIEQRFRPGVLVSDSDVENYYKEHRSAYASVSEDEAQDRIRDQLAEQQVNQSFEEWLDGARQGTAIQYREADLK